MSLNARFSEALLDPARPVPGGLIDPAGRPAGKRFDVYRNNVTVSLTEALVSGFPALHALLGEAFFNALAREFIRAHPPTSPVLTHYGADLAAFLERFEPVAHLGYLPDVARLEFLIRESYHAADAPAADASALAALPADRLMAQRFRLAPALRLLRSRWPVHDIWDAATDAAAPRPGSQAQAVLITRPDFDPMVSLLGPGAPSFILALLDGAELGAAHAAALAKAPEFDLSNTLALLLSGGAITEIYKD